MKLIDATNVNQAYEKGVAYLIDEGVKEDSRNGPVVVAPGPVLTRYTHPTQRVLFSPLRDANPFFHIMEATGSGGDTTLASTNCVASSTTSGISPTLAGQYWRCTTRTQTWGRPRRINPVTLTYTSTGGKAS